MTRRGSGLGRPLGAVARVALILIGLSPFLPPLLSHLGALHVIGDAIDGWFAFQCHREPARSLSIGGLMLPVCSRCFGIYAGLGLGALVLRPRLRVWPLRIWVTFGVLLMLADVFTEALGWRPPLAWLRAATGVLLAYPVGATLVWAARSLGEDERAGPDAHGS